MKREKKIGQSYDTMNLVERRVALLVGARFTDRDKISKASERMGRIRKKLTAKRGDFEGIKEIRKWRDAR